MSEYRDGNSSPSSMEAVEADGDADDATSTGGGFVHVSSERDESDISSTEAADEPRPKSARHLDEDTASYVLVSDPSDAQELSEENEDIRVDCLEDLE
jgi:hypothetical protein